MIPNMKDVDVTNTELQKPISRPKDRHGVLYSPGDEWVWERQIRAVQEQTFTADGLPVEQHVRQAAFYRAAGTVELLLADQERRNRRTHKGGPSRVTIDEASVIRAARGQARLVNGYLSPWRYAVAAVIATLSLSATAVLMFWPEIFLNWVLADLPPREQWPVDGAVVDRVTGVGAWSVMLAVLVCGLSLFLFVLLSGGPHGPRRRKINHKLGIIFKTSVLAAVVSAAGMLMLAFTIAAIVVVAPA